MHKNCESQPFFKENMILKSKLMMETQTRITIWVARVVIGSDISHPPNNDKRSLLHDKANVVFYEMDNDR
jgi:hypothetical protein